MLNFNLQENQTEVCLSQSYKNDEIYDQDIIAQVDKHGVIKTVSDKVAQNLAQLPNLTITNFLSKNEVKSILCHTLYILVIEIQKKNKKDVYHYNW
ncbi:hypothetical protein AAIE21_16560 [Paenibacillus sp. 102]|uniref:hypothetical protein n=1 Tax=Paenibacillus sp. 102 TaxID=3120823 RepID=UPI0031BA0079